MATLTVYPDAHTETTSVDGYISRSNVVESWSTIRAGAGTNAEDTGVQSEIRIASEWNSTNNFAHLYRIALLFDTSALGSGATISAAILTLYGSATKYNSWSHSNFEYNIYTSNPASNTALATGDFTSFGTTKQCDTNITYTAWSDSGANDFTLNATGRGNISKTGITKFGLREALYDAAGAALTWENDKRIQIFVAMADASGTSTDPKLVITYSTVTNYPITAAQGSFTLTGQSAALKIGRKIIAAYGALALTGQNVLLRLGKGMQAVYGSFTLTGQNAILRIAMRMIAAQGSFAQTMQTVIMRYGRTMVAALGSFVLTGQTVLLKLGWKITAVYGQFALTGQSALLHYGRLMTAAVGSFVLTGQSVLLKLGWKMAAAYTTFTLAGQDILLKVGRNIVAAYGAFTLTGQDILFHIAMRMQAVYGQITLTGQTVLFAVNGLYVRWTTAVKNAVATLANRAKNSSTWTNRDKTL